MTEERAKRKMSAILSADVKGYSRLMSQDEEGTVKALKQHRDAIARLVSEHRGRVVDSPGDNVLAEFASVVDATRCAVEIQKTLKDKNAALPEDRQMSFRIGVNLGDIIEEEGRIYGEGVNIAARLEGLAEAGGICISGTTFDQAKNKLSVGYQYLGKQTVKNIADPVRAYKVLMEPEAIGKVMGEEEPELIKRGGRALPLPDKPSIAVLPFDNLSADPQYESIADGVSESIIYALSYLPDMFVIARNSTFTYKGKPVKVRQVAEDLGVRYVLEGSIMRAGDRARVTAQLIDAASDYHIWSGRYDRGMEDFFGVLDDITKTIAIELQMKVSDRVADLSRKTKSFDAWASATRADYLLTRSGKENVLEARKLAGKAVELDPTYGFGWALVAVAHLADGMFGFSESPGESIRLAAQCNEKALNLDPGLSCATACKGAIYMLQGKLEEAITLGEKAIAMGPSIDTNYRMLGMIMSYAGKFEEAIAFYKKAMRLNPFYHLSLLRDYAMSCLMAKRYDEARDTFNELLQRAQEEEFSILAAHLGLCAVYTNLGKEEEARGHVLEILRINPNFSVQEAKKIYRWKDPEYSEQWLSSLHKSGLK
jgi:adenylate cyclase